MQKKPSVVVVGVGAMGLVTGYHLSLAGAEVTFLVRPARLAQLASPQILYCHNDRELKTFSAYRAISSIGEIDTQSLDYVLVTLDGATSRTAEGSALLRSIGTALAGTSTLLLIGGVGVGLREHYLMTTGLPPDQVLNSFLGLLSYQIDKADIPVNPPARPEIISQAGMAFVQFPNKVGYIIDSSYPQAAKDFAALYNRCGVSRCAIMNPTLFKIVGNMPFPLFAISEIAGWPKSEDLARNKQLWRLNRLAQGEIMGLKQHGWIGKLMRLVMTGKMHLKLAQKLEKDSLPIDFGAFNRFHHGGKVQAQDIEIMQNCVAVGVSQGYAMSALKEVLARLDAHKKAKAGVR